MNPLVSTLLKGVWDLGKDWMSRKKEKAEAKHQVKLKEIEQDALLIKGGIKSWKDEWWTIIVSLPLVQLMMAPVVELFMLDEPYYRGAWTDAVLAGLEALNSVPDWHIYIATASALYSFGIKPTTKAVTNLVRRKQ